MREAGWETIHSKGSGVKTALAQMPALPLAGCASLGKLLNHSVFQLLHLCNRDEIMIYLLYGVVVSIHCGDSPVPGMW